MADGEADMAVNAKMALGTSPIEAEHTQSIYEIPRTRWRSYRGKETQWGVGSMAAPWLAGLEVTGMVFQGMKLQMEGTGRTGSSP